MRRATSGSLRTWLIKYKNLAMPVYISLFSPIESIEDNGKKMTHTCIIHNVKLESLIHVHVHYTFTIQATCMNRLIMENKWYK